MQSSPRAAAQRQIRTLSAEIMRKKTLLARLRKKLPWKPIVDYRFRTPNGTVPLSSLFGEHDELIVVHNMGTSCPYCTAWADGFNGIFPHVAHRAAFVVMSPDSPAIQQRFAHARGWKFPMVSTMSTTFRKDMGFVARNGMPQPGMTVCARDRDGHLFEVTSEPFGPGDNFCVIYDLFDCLPTGNRNWPLQFSYGTKRRAV